MATDTQVIKVGNGSQLWRDLKSHQGAKGDKGDTGAKGNSIENVRYDGTDLYVKVEGSAERNLGRVKGEKGDQGPQGEPGPQGEKGEPGKAFTYEDLTPEQRLAIRGAEIDTSGFASKADLDGKANKTHTHAQSDITGLQTSLNSKANVSHTHSISNINSLQTTLDKKSDKGHTHPIGEVTGLQSQLDGKGSKDDVDQKINYIKVDSDGHVKYIKSQADFRPDGPWKNVIDSKPVALKDHTHEIGDITGLQGALDDKANKSDLENVNVDLSDYAKKSDLNNKADSNHTHNISDVTGLESQLNDTALRVRVIDDGTVQWLKNDNSWWQINANNKVALKDHTHSIVDVTNLQNELDKKSHVNHRHTVFDINGLQNQLDNIGKIKDYQSGQWLSAYVVSSGQVPSDTSGKIVFERE